MERSELYKDRNQGLMENIEFVPLRTTAAEKNEEEKEADFNPFLSPPNIKLAKLHGVNLTDQKCSKAGGYWSVYDFNDPNTSKLVENLEEIKQKPTVVCPCCNQKDVKAAHQERPVSPHRHQVCALLSLWNCSARLLRLRKVLFHRPLVCAVDIQYLHHEIILQRRFL
jgi:hypothetical protein